MNQAIVALRSALQNLSRGDLDDLTIEEMERLECDLSSWANVVYVANIGKKAAIRDEEVQ